MKKLFVAGVVCLVSLASCKSGTCPAYSNTKPAQSHATEMANATPATDKDRI
ncbi:MAG: hypothetical protein AVDCRST_MAG95-2108 [uncultured Adhaeribacter sp.]|uniref:Uncharacterized protein n=1 Tax=uncultured Adhaeribacter sp. TaxID=448109 RepID=A0A6J4ILV0_9BACT|nr:MAG: hypothetical protein AVDCRST_MAG95-2108 [uncultured Adhaeribacter sp.]